MTAKKKSELREMISGLMRKYHSEYERAEAYRELSARMMRRNAELENALKDREESAAQEPAASSTNAENANGVYGPLYVSRIETKSPGAGRMPEKRAAAPILFS